MRTFDATEEGNGMIFSIPLSKLRPVAILSDGDLHDLAEFKLRGYDALASDKRGFGLKRPTVYSLVSDFVHLFSDLPRSEVVEKLEEFGFNMDDMIEWDDIQWDD